MDVVRLPAGPRGAVLGLARTAAAGRRADVRRATRGIGGNRARDPARAHGADHKNGLEIGVFPHKMRSKAMARHGSTPRQTSAGR